jgi:hypothetical protein
MIDPLMMEIYLEEKEFNAINLQPIHTTCTSITGISFTKTTALKILRELSHNLQEFPTTTLQP